MDRENHHDIFATEIPKKFHNHEGIIEAKNVELNRWKEYDAGLFGRYAGGCFHQSQRENKSYPRRYQTWVH